MPPKANKKRRTTRGNTVVTTTTTTTTTSDDKNTNNKRTVAEMGQENEDAEDLVDPYNGALPIKLLDQMNRLKKPFYRKFIETNKQLFNTLAGENTATETENDSTTDATELNKLLNTWEYQYVVSFMYCTFPSFFNKNRERKGYFGKKPIPQPPKMLRDLIASHQSASSLGSNYSSGIRVSARQQQLNLQKEQELSERLESIDFEGQLEYGPDQRKFHEILFIQDLLSYINNSYKFSDDIIAFPEYKGDTFAWLLMELAKLYNQDQSFCDEQGCLLNHENWFSESWSSSDIIQKFKILFAVVKFVEIRNSGIRNYINDNLDLFYFPRFDVEIEKTTKTQTAARRTRKKAGSDDADAAKPEPKTPETVLSRVETQEQFMLMHGGKVVKIIRTVTSPLNLPLREDHAYSSEGTPLVNFQEEVEQYSDSIKFEYEIVAFEFDSLMHFNTNVTEFYENNLEVEKTDDLKEYSPNEDNEEIDEDYTLRQVYMNTKYGLNLFNNRMRQRESEAFFNNKKTSQIFIDKISEKNKKLLEEETKEKSQKQREFLNKSNYLRNKSQRIVRDQVIASLWERYHSLQLSSDAVQEQEFFTLVDAEVSNLKFETYFFNVPYCLVWKDEDLKKLEVNDLYLPNTKDVYQMNWMFNCSCDHKSHTLIQSPNNKTAKDILLDEKIESLENLTVIENDSNIELVHEKNIKGDIISCVKCNRWGHFSCFADLLEKDALYAGIIAALNQIDIDSLKSLKPSAFSVAFMGGVEQIQEEEEDSKETGNINGHAVQTAENENDDASSQKSLTKEETESKMVMDNIDVTLKSPEASGVRVSRRAAASKEIDYTGKSAYQAVEEEPRIRRSSRKAAEKENYDEEIEEEELVHDGRPSFLSQFPIGPLENLLTSTHPITKLLFRGMDGEKAESQEDLEIIYDTLYQRFYKIICYQCCRNLSENIVKAQFPELLKQELIRQAKNELAKQKRLAKKQQKLEQQEAAIATTATVTNPEPAKDVVEQDKAAEDVVEQDKPGTVEYNTNAEVPVETND